MTGYPDAPKGPVLLGSMAKAFIGMAEAIRLSHNLVFTGHEEMIYRLNEIERQSPPDQRACYDESGPWPPVPVDPIVAKQRDIRIHKAAAKRKRKNLKRLKDAGRT